MKSILLFTVVLPFTVFAVGCVTTSTTSTTWTAPPVAEEWSRPGRVEWIREVVHRQEGNPVGGAVAGAIIGGMLGGRGPAAVVGAVGGAAIGAAASQGGAESRNYEVFVRYHDGGHQMFVWGGYCPFRPVSRSCSPLAVSPGCSREPCRVARAPYFSLETSSSSRFAGSLGVCTCLPQRE
jgi:outer membrane lipoprotein SlyB